MKNKDVPKYIVGIVLLVAVVGVVSLLGTSGGSSINFAGLATASATCTDTDSGFDYLTKGTVSGVKTSGANYTKTDYCDSEGRLQEFYCSSNTKAVVRVKDCTTVDPNYVCSDGACAEKDAGEKSEAAGSESEEGEEPKALEPALAALFGRLFFVALFVFLLLYVYVSLVLMAIAKKTGTPYAWLAWVPIANVYLMTQIGKLPWWLTLGVFLTAIPYVGALAFLVLLGVLWWKIAEARNRPGWWGIVILLVPIVNLILMGILAWSKDGISMERGPNHSKLIKYFRDNMAQGYTKKQIADACIQHGYTKEEVDAVIREI